MSNKMTTTFLISRKMQLPETLKSILRTLGFMGQPPIESYRQLIDHTAKNAAYVSQVTLYTYIKARAGTQYPKLFTNEDFLTSLRIARWHIFGAAVADMALFAAAQFHGSGAFDHDQSATFAGGIMDEVLTNYEQQDVAPKVFLEMLAEGHRRAAFANWADIADGPAAFKTSSDAVFHWAPIADELKVLDEEILRNSIHLRWIGVRRDTKASLRPAMILESWRQGLGGPAGQ
jgi:hypothetical protein